VRYFDYKTIANDIGGSRGQVGKVGGWVSVSTGGTGTPDTRSQPRVMVSMTGNLTSQQLANTPEVRTYCPAGQFVLSQGWGSVRVIDLSGHLTTSVLAPAPYFGNMRLLGLFAIFATVLAVFFRRTTAGRVRAFLLFFSHDLPLSMWTWESPLMVLCLMLSRASDAVKVLCFDFDEGGA
jgi:hypothetical protein